MVYIMTDYKQFRHMNASYKLMNENKVIFFKSYSTEVFYIDGTSLYPYFSFLEYTGSTTQKQITTFLRSNLLDGIRESNLIEKGYKAVLKWGRINYERGTRFSVTCYPLYMVVTNSYDTKMYRVSYDGKTLKEI